LPFLRPVRPNIGIDLVTVFPIVTEGEILAAILHTFWWKRCGRSIMRIGPSRKGEAAGRKSVGGSKASKAATSDVQSPQTQQTPTEGSELIGRLRAFPEIRPEVIDDVERRLRDGDLLTRQAARRTAEAILAEITDSTSPES
jgi:hypothetical protein